MTNSAVNQIAMNSRDVLECRDEAKVVVRVDEVRKPDEATGKRRERQLECVPCWRNADEYQQYGVSPDEQIASPRSPPRTRGSRPSGSPFLTPRTAFRPNHSGRIFGGRLPQTTDI